VTRAQRNPPERRAEKEEDTQMTGLVRFLILRRWGWFVLTALLAAVAAPALAGAHPLRAIQVDGTIADYQEITSAGSYDHNELKLTGDERDFRLNKKLFHPALPDEVVREGRVSLWVDEGSEFVVAITLYDEHDANPVQHTTDLYDNPDSNRQGSYIVTGIIGGFGVLCLLVGLAWPLFPWGRKGAAQPALPDPVDEAPQP
jgi:hypothetical protein